MSGYYNNQSDSDDLEGGQNSSGGGLRKQLEEALGEIRSLREQMTSGERQKTVTELLKDKGLDPAVKELIPKDANPTEWVEKYSYLLGAKGATASTDHEPTAPEIQVAPDDDPALVAEREALASIRDAQESGSQATVSNDLLDQLNKFSDGSSEAELLAFFKKNGMA